MSTQTDQVGMADASWIVSLTYRSEAVREPSRSELDALVANARVRNHNAGITGMLLHDSGRFLQTLEGPPDSLEEVWGAIKRDPRHGAIEVLSHHMIPARLFSGWDMQFYSRTSRLGNVVALGSGVAALTDHIPDAAKFALSGDDVELNALIANLVAQGWASDALVRHLLEPTARALGDAWLADECNELDLTIGLSILQLAGHTVFSRPCVDSIRNSRYSILLVTAPGERHGLGSSLLGDMFTNAGWDVDIAHPDSDESLAAQLRDQQPDAVDIALSDAMPRDHALATLRETIEHGRQAAPDDMLVVSVGGRLFAEAAATAQSVGADYARTSAAGTTIPISQLIEQRRREDQPASRFARPEG